MSAPAFSLGSVILKVAERCNLKCTYCYMYEHADQSYLHRPRFMSAEIYEQTLQRIKSYCDALDGTHEIWLTFHGGEPTLVGAAAFDRMATRARDVLGSRLANLSLQTNGTLIDDDWVETLKRHSVNVGVSLDGPALINDARRIDFQGRGSHAAVVAGLRRLQDGGLQPGVLTVIDPLISGLDVYHHLRELEVTSIDFLIPDVTHDSKPLLYPGLTGTPVADYLVPIFDEWFAEDDPDVIVRLFWSILRELMGGESMTDVFGNQPMSYAVVESDGAIEALDVLKVCGVGVNGTGLNVATDDLAALTRSDGLGAQILRGEVALSPVCQACPERVVCGGGYIPHRYSSANGFANPSAWCADILKLVGHIRSTTLLH